MLAPQICIKSNRARADEVTASPLPFCRFAPFPLKGESTSAPTICAHPFICAIFQLARGAEVVAPYGVVRCSTHRRDSPCGCPHLRTRVVETPTPTRLVRCHLESCGIQLCSGGRGSNICRFGQMDYRAPGITFCKSHKTVFNRKSRLSVVDSLLFYILLCFVFICFKKCQHFINGRDAFL